MLLSNLTFCLSKNVSNDFERWIKVEIQQDYLSNIEIKTFKLLTKVDENSENYSIQFFIENNEELEKFENSVLKILIKNTQIVFGGEYAYFQTLLETF